MGEPATATAATGLLQTLLIYGGSALLLFVATHGVIPELDTRMRLEPVVLWFVVGGVGVFLPLLVGGILMLRTERWLHRRDLWRARLRFQPMTKADWLSAVAALFVIAALTGLLAMLVAAASGSVPAQPSFMAFEPRSADRYWILAAWAPFWIVNIFVEEFVWRGVILPRQELALGRGAWLANSGGWLLFHFAFGWQVAVLLLPIVLVLPYVVQQRENTSVGVVIHAALNGAAFIAIAFGVA